MASEEPHGHAHVAMRRYRATQFPVIRPVLLALYREVYADRLTEPLFTMEQFTGRMDYWVTRPGWEAVLAYEGENAVGSMLGIPIPAGSTYWADLEPSVDADFGYETGRRSFATMDLMLRVPWRGCGVGHRIHEELLVNRTEERIVGSVEHSRPRLLEYYKSWGYSYAGTKKVFPEVGGGIALDVIVRPLRYP